MEISRNSGLTKVEVLAVVAFLLLLCVIALPGLNLSRRASNERNASSALKMLSAAEADFRSNDRDGNHVNDFWTGDVKGLYTMTSAEVRGAGAAPKDPPIKLIALDLAAADADPALVPAGGENMPLNCFATASTLKGYWIAALVQDMFYEAASDTLYRQDTGGTPAMGKCHHPSRFGFAAVPDSLGTGAYVFHGNESNSVCRRPVAGKPVRSTAIPPGLDAIPKAYLHWPDDAIRKKYYGNIEDYPPVEPRD